MKKWGKVVVAAAVALIICFAISLLKGTSFPIRNETDSTASRRGSAKLESGGVAGSAGIEDFGDATAGSDKAESVSPGTQPEHGVELPLDPIDKNDAFGSDTGIPDSNNSESAVDSDNSDIDFDSNNESEDDSTQDLSEQSEVELPINWL